MPEPPIPRTLFKKQGEVRLFDFGFGNFFEFVTNPPQQIGNAVVTYTGDDGTLTVSTPAIGGTRAQVLIYGGTPGAQYVLTAKVYTIPNLFVLVQDGFLRIDPD
jgi:hypothetical protein